MGSGNGQVSVAVLALLGVLAAAWAGQARKQDVQIRFPGRGCTETLQFERLNLDEVADQPALIASQSRLVAFDWQPETSELTFRTRAASPAITLPERFVKAASLPHSPNCE